MNNSNANATVIESINMLLMLGGSVCFIEICPIQYLHNLIEQAYRFIKKHQPMTGFKALHSTQAAIAGIETAHIIRKGQLSDESMPAFQPFMALAE